MLVEHDGMKEREDMDVTPHIWDDVPPTKLGHLGREAGLQQSMGEKNNPRGCRQAKCWKGSNTKHLNPSTSQGTPEGRMCQRVITDKAK